MVGLNLLATWPPKQAQALWVHRSRVTQWFRIRVYVQKCHLRGCFYTDPIQYFLVKKLSFFHNFFSKSFYGLVCLFWSEYKKMYLEEKIVTCSWHILTNSKSTNPQIYFMKNVLLLQLNEYETAPYFIQFSQNLTCDCLLISVFSPEFTWAEPKIVLNIRTEQF